MSREIEENPVAGNSLLCGESKDFIGFPESGELSSPERRFEETGGQDVVFVGSDECERVEELIGKEPSWGFGGRTPSDSAGDSFRSDAVDWIVNTSASFGFHHHTAFLSITYFDRFLAARSVEAEKLWAVRLLSLASLLLAAKMEECKVPALPDLCVQNYVFDNKCIKKMEFLILTTLEWRMASVTPYTYLGYFIRKIFKLPRDKEKELLFIAMDLALAVSKEINTVDYRPSVVAAAAVLASSGDEHTRKSIASTTCSISSGVSIDWERVYECYTLIQNIKSRRDHKTPGNIAMISAENISQDPRCNPAKSTRKRLLFSESQETSVNKMHKRNTNANANEYASAE
ncbi:hypothetical protein MLD38_031387 [Melastoma candidum]|uniref:Uncharacterized protein n=1 Tax=Melastoma candidum TaxID=119954 RepID=A0ACB9MPC6_9MYRT|nr:hypothetical protein MLD38_031387 [Melastoma candidum]